jgi:hypothetical protein
MLFLMNSMVSLAIGFVLGRVWEIRQDIKRHAGGDLAHLPSAPSDRSGRAGRPPSYAPRDSFARNKSQMGF